MILAWEDNMEYGWEWVRDSSSFDQYTTDLFSQMVDHYYEIYSIVFFPQADVESYVNRMNEAETRLLNLSQNLSSALERYR
jgi:hypothetical protein